MSRLAVSAVLVAVMGLAVGGPPRWLDAAGTPAVAVASNVERCC